MERNKAAIYEEIAAQYCGSIKSRQMLNEAMEETKVEKGFLQKVVDKFKEIVAGIQSAIERLRGKDMILDATLREDEKTVQTLLYAFDSILNKALENGKGKVDEDGEVKYSKTLSEKDNSIKEQLKENEYALNKMEPVYSGDVDFVFTNKENAVKWALQHFEKNDFLVNRTGIGDILFDKKRVSKGISYLTTPEEIMAFAALNDVVKNGIVIKDAHQHKDRAYKTLTIAAPVIINGVRGNTAVVIRQENGNYYKVHRILMPDGSVFSIDKTKNNTAGTDPNYKNPDLSSKGVAYKGIVTQKPADVKENFENLSSEPVYSRKVTEELEKKNLVAIHNLTESNLLDIFNLGGFPMPSIAITKSNILHDGFGDISVLFRKDTIDPKNKSNAVYSTNAYTPTFPEINYKINDSVRGKIYNTYSELKRKYGDKASGLYNIAVNTENAVNNVGVKKIKAKILDNANLQELFLQEKGIELPPVKTTKKTVTKTYANSDDAKTADYYTLFYEYLGKDFMDGYYSSTKKLEYFNDNIEHIKQAEKKANKETFNDTGELSRFLLKGKFNNAIDFHETGGKEDVTINDSEERDSFVSKNAKIYGYENWVDNLLDGIVEKKGLRNTKDKYDTNGNPRSFEQLNYEYNLENIVKAMKAQGEKGVFAFGGSIFGASANKYKSVDEIKQDQSRLKKFKDNEFDEIKKEFVDRFSDICESFVKYKDNYDSRQSAANLLVESVAKRKTRNGISEYLKKEGEGWTNYSEHIVDDLLELVNDIGKMPTKYFEAKPQRVVGIDEIAAVILPKNSSKELINKLEENGIPYEIYSDDGDRLNATNKAADGAGDIRFSRKVTEEEYKQPITREDINTLRKMFPDRKSINDFTPEEIEATQKWAYKFYQQMGTKSPFFRAWFGDWREQDRKPISIIETNANTAYKAGKEKNNDSNIIISWGDQLKGETRRKYGVDSDTYSDLSAISEIVKNAVLLNTVTSKKNSKSKMENTAFMHSLYAVVNNGKTKDIVKLIAEEAFSEKINDDFIRGYELQTIKKVATLHTGVLAEDSGLTRQVTTVDTVADLYSLVKQYDKDFSAGKPVNPLLLNKDGTPKGFYHGTNAEFTVFDNSKIGTFENGNAFWDGEKYVSVNDEHFFFTSDKTLAKEHADGAQAENGGVSRIIEGYVSPEKPLVVEVDEWYARKKHYTAQDWYDKNRLEILSTYHNGDYDSIIIFNPVYENDIMVAISESNQIKSATDNIGTFNRGNNDIRYSRKLDNVQGRMQEISDNENLDEALTQAKMLMATMYKMLHAHELSKTVTNGLIPKRSEITALVKKYGITKDSGFTPTQMTDTIMKIMEDAMNKKGSSDTLIDTLTNAFFEQMLNETEAIESEVIKAIKSTIGKGTYYIGEKDMSGLISNSESLKYINRLLNKTYGFRIVSESSKKMDATAAFVHHLYCPVSINGEKGIAKLYVTENVDDEHKFYLTKIEMEPSDSMGQRKLSAPNSSDDSAISLSEIYAFVKSHNADFEKDTTQILKKTATSLQSSALSL